MRRLLPDYSMNATKHGINELSGWYTVSNTQNRYHSELQGKWKQIKWKTETEKVKTGNGRQTATPVFGT